MNAYQFLSEFGHIVSAPNGVQRVRELIIYLAVHGGLHTSGNSDHVAAHQLLIEADTLKQKISEDKKGRRQHPLPAIPEVNAADYPDTWVLARLGRIVHLVSGQHLTAEEQNNTGVGIPYFTGASDFGPFHPVVTRWTSVSRAVAQMGDILIAVKGTIGKINVLDLERAALGRQLMAVRALAVDPAFLALILRSSEYYFLEKGVGIAIPGISRDDILHLIVGIPSRDEQKRIVAKVDELMVLCDKLEAQQKERQSLRSLTCAVALTALADAKSNRDLKHSWNRISQHIRLLFDNPNSIQYIRDSILELAARGKLSLRTSDASARNEVAAMIAIRRQAIETGSTRRSKKLLSNDSIEIEELFPNHWIPTRLGHITLKLGSGSTPKGGREIYVQKGIKFLRSQNVWNSGLQLKDVAFIPEETHERMSDTHVEAGDILLNITGASIGRAAIVPDDWDTANVSQHVAIIRLTDKRLNQFVHMWLISPVAQRQIMSVQVGISREGLSMEKLQNFVLYIPPQEERDKILEQVGRFGALCDNLADQLSKAVATLESLVAASVASIIGIRIEDTEKMKAPKTELVSPLHIGVVPMSGEQAPLASILIRNNGELPAKVLWKVSGLEIEPFYQQLRVEIAQGWIAWPEVAYMNETEAS